MIIQIQTFKLTLSRIFSIKHAQTGSSISVCVKQQEGGASLSPAELIWTAAARGEAAPGLSSTFLLITGVLRVLKKILTDRNVDYTPGNWLEQLVIPLGGQISFSFTFSSAFQPPHFLLWGSCLSFSFSFSLNTFCFSFYSFWIILWLFRSQSLSPFPLLGERS